MTDEKGGSVVVFLVALICVAFWNNQPTQPKVEPSPMPSDLIEQVASMNHFPDVTKIDEPKPVPSPSDKPSKPEIIIFTSASCPPCERWKKCEASKFEANGWKVAYCEQHEYPRTPTFLLTKDGKTVERVGYFTFEQLAEVWK
jgi:hypothetical protein